MVFAVRSEVDGPRLLAPGASSEILLVDLQPDDVVLVDVRRQLHLQRDLLALHLREQAAEAEPAERRRAGRRRAPRRRARAC